MSQENNQSCSPESCGCGSSPDSCGHSDGCGGCGSARQQSEQITTPIVACFGVFDGIHFGHREIISAVFEEAEKFKALPVILTFSIDPMQVVNPDAPAKKLLSDEDRQAFLNSFANVAVIPFDDVTASYSPDEFIDFLMYSLPTIASVHVGEGFRFGENAEGDTDTLKKLLAPYGAQVHVHELLRIDDDVVSSSRIRKLIERAELAQANKLTGRPYTLRGVVKHGRGEGGSVLGVPTANLELLADYVMAPDGVYSGYVAFGNADLAAFDVSGDKTARANFKKAVICIGEAPTFKEAPKDGDETTWGEMLQDLNPTIFREFASSDTEFPHTPNAPVEVHVIDDDGDYYDQMATVVFIKKLRDNKRFENFEALKGQIQSDIERAKQMLPEYK